LQLYIAEKPSLGRAIADALPGKSTKHKGYITVGDVTVSWCIGHLLEQAAPDAYGEQYKRWTRETLPIVPSKWKWSTKPSTRAQLNVLKGLLKKATQVVHAGDPDREGQLLVDEVLHYLNWQGPTSRVLISDLNLNAVKKALKQPRDNKEFRPLSTSALARARADWLYGMNLTRAWTIAAKRHGIQSVLSVGRVQTPLLGLIVKRDEEIQQFDSHDYYDIRLKISDSQQNIEAKWLPKESPNISLDSLGHAINKQEVNQVVAQLPGQAVQLISNQHEEFTRSAPKPFSLSKLQVAAGKRYKMQAKQVLDTCQALYEKHKLITYPRSDCEYLPSEHHSDAPEIIAATSSLFNNEPWLAKVDATIKSRAFNSKQVGAHHAIVPTQKSAAGRQLTSDEKNIYELVCRQYLAQFVPPFNYRDNELRLTCCTHHFVAKARHIIEAGWTDILLGASDEHPALPAWNQATQLIAGAASIDHKKTKPPAHYTDATLIAAMSNIARFVEDPNLKLTLKETDGLGTEATRASMIETLDKRGYIIRVQRKILPADLGRGLIASLPSYASSPDMTANWEQQLALMVDGQAAYAPFMGALLDGVEQLLQASDITDFSQLSSSIGKAECKSCGAELKRAKSKRSWYWKCTQCEFSASDNNGIPGAPRRKKAQKAANKTGVNCPKCAQPLVERRSKRGNFWGCSGYPNCTHTQPAGRTTLDIR